MNADRSNTRALGAASVGVPLIGGLVSLALIISGGPGAGALTAPRLGVAVLIATVCATGVVWAALLAVHFHDKSPPT